jgi:formyl-CoA transferase
LKTDPRFAKNHLRHQNRRAIAESIEAVSSQEPARHWVDALDEAGVPCGVLQNYQQVFRDPHLNERSFFPEAPHNKRGPPKQIRSPIRLSAAWPAPA